MKLRRLATARLPLVAVLAALLAARSAHAALTWDANAAGAGVTDGAGAWLAASQWWDGANNVNWTSTSDAVFGNGGTGGAVTLASPTTVNSFTFNSFSGTYTLGAAGQAITLNSGGLTLNSGAGAVGIISPVTLGAAQSWLNNASGVLTVGIGAVTNGGFLLTFGGSGNTTVSSAIGGTGGLTKRGNGALALTGANGYTGTTSVTGGMLAGAQTSGTPFGTGMVTVGAGILSLVPAGTGTNVAVSGGTTAAATKFTFNPGATLALNKGTQTSLTYTFGGTGATWVRGTNGTLILGAGAIANLGNTVAGGGERFLINGTAPAMAGTANLVDAVVAQDRGNSNAGDFVTYGAANGFAVAAPDLLNDLSTSTNATYVSISNPSIPTGGAVAAYALKVSGQTLTNTGTLTLGGGATGVAGLILNSGTISGGILTTPTSVAAELTIYTSGTSVISSSVNTATSQAGMSVFGPGSLDFSSSSSNSFTGGLRINNSTVIASSNNQLGGSSSQITLTGGTLQTSGTFALGGGNRAITLAMGQDQSGGTINVTGGTTTYQNNGTGSKILSGTGSLTKTGPGTLVLTGNTTNTYTGGTFVNTGTLQLGAANMLADSGAVTLGGGTFDIQTYSDTVGTLNATGSAVIHLGSSGAALAFAASNGIAWAGTLNLTGAFVSGSSLRFGTTSSGLTSTQLGKISATGFSSFALNANGYLTATAAGAYASWTTGPFLGTLTDTNPAHDCDGGGLPTAIEWVVQGDPTNPADDASVMPTLDSTTDAKHFLFVFRRTAAALADANTTIAVEYGSDLGGWHNSLDNGPADGVVTSVATNGFGSGIDKVTVAIPRTLAVGNKLFARLKVVVAIP